MSEKELSTVEDLRARISGQLEGLWNVLYGNPEHTAKLVALHEDVVALALMAETLEAAVEASAVTAYTLEVQRDLAIGEANAARRYAITRAVQRAVRELSEAISGDFPDVDPAAVEAALNYFHAGKGIEINVSSFSERDFVEALVQIGEELLEE